jgi:AcrR family transcriptional regulator
MDKKTKWLTEGFNLVIVNGFSGFNVDVLCKKMGVAKTSFYHFFGSRDLFLEELIKYWASESAKEVLISIQKSSTTGKLDKFITHKKKFVPFYCFLILANQYVANKPKLHKIVENIVADLWERTDEFIVSLIPQSVIDKKMKSLIHTFLVGWDYLYAFKIYHNKKAGAEPLEELKVFLNNFVENAQNQLLAS